MIKDKLNRKFEYLRISVTDKCNYRCIYCMPKDIFGSKYQFLRKSELLSYEEIIKVAKTLKPFGLKKIRLTGGEPLLRKNIERLINGLKKDALIEKVMITTNGSLLTKNKLIALKENGLDSITISLDSLSQRVGNIMNPINNSNFVSEAINDVIDIFGSVKINMVVMKEINDKEIIPMINRFIDKKIELRFIEYMDVGESNNWSLENVFTSKETKSIIGKYFNLKKLPDLIDSTSEKWSIDDHTLNVAFISSISKPFCSECNRGRLSANGNFYTCLFSGKPYNFSNYFRNEESSLSFDNYFKQVWSNRNDQYSQLRLITKPNKDKSNKVEMSHIGG
ncbi:MAG: GTP 3',8-cyclase MoaA [Gammaproteobacteria bacterium]|jgi:GTP 3',8-cyclase|nr:GTP 3',8-cyclase MoaA [Gammaproteobacteria bacterium]MBT4462635.1 GTP 3',8-cyclase MoaA [Gammaproteobacteria bacterium]MBT4654882.1 GTP 3',8-cyclase MoaA [Gammaproteobacteria bacterium]MBT5116618.1 GTP 3',8-cyclase MoaA [Gammaproteobacteria bacterium]MBT5761755.1 GTP 3',8-cyclase MoaA [Gammaproteobacteria bacterium]